MTRPAINEYKETVSALFAKGQELLGDALAERSYDRPAKLWERLGQFIGGPFAGSVGFNTDECVPSSIFRIKKDGEKLFVELVDVTYETEGICLTEANSKYRGPRSFGMIGYDTEFLAKPETMLSHQFCFDIGPGKRFGFILDTDIRFTDESLRDFLAAIIIKIKGCELNDWYIFAHFSLAEGSWVDSSGKKLIQRKLKEWRGKLTIAERSVLKAVGAPTASRAAKGVKVPKVAKTKAPKPVKIKVTFADTMNLDPRSLKAAAKDCGLEKYSLISEEYEKEYWFKKNCANLYEHFDDFKEAHPGEFYRYGVRDAIITAGIPIVLHSKFGADADFQVRTARYSEKHMSDWFRENYAGIHDGWQRVLGQRKLVIPAKKAGAEPFVKWEPDKLQRQILYDWYKGGRNEARQIGCFSKPVSYFDMTSAYPTALAALASDFDFGTSLVRTRNDGAVQRINQLMLKGPFQPHGVGVYIRFRPTCKVPMAPLSAEAGIIFPLETEGQVVCWPEYWTAKMLDIIEEEFVLALYEFKARDTRLLPDKILEMIKLRQQDKVFYKSILNYLSGKFAQGKRKGIPPSTISCPALAAYLTSTTRAAAAEIGNLNEYYAITTDGIISPEPELTPGEINKRLAERLKPTGFEWMKNEFTGDKAVIWKTRGYILFKSTVDPTAPAKERFKQAKMGLQGEEPVDFIKQIKEGKGIRRSAKTFAKLNDGEIFSFMEKEFKVNPNFDFKYSIKRETVHDDTIEIDGVELTMPCFDTQPLRNINEHYELRRISDWKVLKKVLKQDRKDFSVKDINELIQTSLLNDGRCRHMVWEFRKRMARIVQVVDVDVKKLSQNAIIAMKKKPLYPIPIEYGDIEDFRPILETEVAVITDAVRRGDILDGVIKLMEKARSYPKKQKESVEAEIEEVEQLEEVDDGTCWTNG